MSHDHLVAREGWPYIGFFLVLVLGFYAFNLIYLAVLSLMLAVFTVFFFRNPNRSMIDSKDMVVAPADGRILSIEKVFEDKYLQEEALKVSIFLSLFNVHINRSPAEGQVEWIRREGFSFLPAYKSEASNTNVRNYLGMFSPWGKILVVQITGFVARRLVCWVKPGDSLQVGERFGLIKFGSCTELYLPKDTSILVSVGQRVRGGETVIGRFDQ